MAIDFNNTFGKGARKSFTSETTTDRPKAKYWLNIGYEVDSPVEGEETRFVSLPVGIPVDTMEKVPTNSKNDVHAAFQSARNDLLDQIMAAAEGLAPGEAVNINLTLQLRAVGEEREDIAPDNNPFVAKVNLLG